MGFDRGELLSRSQSGSSSRDLTDLVVSTTLGRELHRNGNWRHPDTWVAVGKAFSKLTRCGGTRDPCRVLFDNVRPDKVRELKRRPTQKLQRIAKIARAGGRSKTWQAHHGGARAWEYGYPVPNALQT